MKKQTLTFLLLLSLTACNTPPVEDVEVITGENQILEDQAEENQYEQTVDFLGMAEKWSVTELVEENRDYYIENAPAEWAAYQEKEDYPEHMKLYLHAWKTGTFKNTDYAGQSLVLVQQDCEGPCSGAFFRYAVDESTDTWTLLTAYSTQDAGWVAGPTDSRDETVEIPELEVPETLEGYTKDSVALLSPFSRLNSNQFPEDDQIQNMDGLTALNVFQDSSFPNYFSAQGCLYGVSPDGLMARYTVLPTIFMSTEKEGNFDQAAITGKELSFTSLDGNSEDKTFALSIGGCGLAWSCVSTFELTKAEEANLKEAGTLDGRTVYLPKSVEERSELGTEYDLEQRIYGAFDSYLMSEAYDLGQDPSEYQASSTKTVQEFLEMNSTFLIKLDNGTYTLTFESKNAPTAECGKPVIYLYPEKNMLVRVQVGIEEFTKTIPDYGQKGWTVLARSSGLLTNLADKLNYPYLFWEGNSSQAMDAGSTWTLAKVDVATRLPEALLGMGLNNQETADFMEFWLPKLEAVTEPYVEFAFVGNEAMDQIAPLTIKPAPDQVIRLFMYYRGAEEAGFEMPAYKPEARHGFTVIEWGGSLY